MPHKTFLTNNYNSTKFRLNGLIPSARPPNKPHLCQAFHDHIVYRAEQLPPKVDLRSDMTPVEDQSRIGSCAANCLAGAYEYLTKKANGRNTDVSRLFIYYNARVKDQKSQNVVDTGCTMTSAIEALEEFGTCLESVWPYDISRVNSRPNDQAYQEANRQKITEALRININLTEMKSCLAQGFPFAFGLKLYTSFDQASGTGVVPMPNTGDDGRESHGSHAMLAVGYSDQSQAFIVRNSWGEQWGDKGYCYIPYAYITNSNLCFDVWTVRKVAMDNFGREHWDVNDMINYVRVKAKNISGDQINDDSQIIEADDDDYDRKDGFDNPWNPYRAYGYNYSNNNNDYYGNNQNNNYDRNSSFDNPWNPYPAYGYSYSNNNNEYYGNDQNNNYDRKSSFNNSWNPYRPHTGNNYSENDNDKRYDSAFGGNNSYSDFHQFRYNENFSGFGGGYSGFDQFMNNRPNFSDNQFHSPPLSNGYQQYGVNYGYTSSFDNFMNPFF